jgi:hypothetical protein
MGVAAQVLDANVGTSALKMGAISIFERLVPKSKLTRLLSADVVRPCDCLVGVCDAAVQAGQWRRTGPAAGVASSESEDRDRLSGSHRQSDRHS